nr:hypothetical protein CFP56_39497 [Quercus suber]
MTSWSLRVLGLTSTPKPRGTSSPEASPRCLILSTSFSISGLLTSTLTRVSYGTGDEAGKSGLIQMPLSLDASDDVVDG